MTTLTNPSRIKSLALQIASLIALIAVPAIVSGQAVTAPEVTFSHTITDFGRDTFELKSGSETNSVDGNLVKWECEVRYVNSMRPGQQFHLAYEINGTPYAQWMTEGVWYKFEGERDWTSYNHSTLAVLAGGGVRFDGTWSWNGANPDPVTNVHPPVTPCFVSSFGGGRTCLKSKYNYVCAPNTMLDSFGWRTHYSVAGQGPGGCSSCGGSSVPGSSSDDNLLYIGQVFIPSNQASIGNCSPGVYFNFDQRTEFHEFNSTKIATFFSPTEGRVFYYEYDATESAYVQLIDDNGTDLESDVYYGMMTLEDSTGNPVTDPTTISTQTVYSFVTSRSGWTYKSELVDVDATSAVAPMSRLLEATSPNGKVLTFTYKYNAGDPALTGAPMKILMIDKITDWQGSTATFTYNSSQQASRWVVSDIDIVAQGHSGTVTRSLRYTYNGNGHLHQVYRDFNGTEELAATYTYGTDTQWQAATIEMDEQFQALPMEQTIYVSQDYRTWENQLVNQFSNVLVGAADGAGTRYLTVFRDMNNPGNYRILENGELTEWEAGVSVIACSSFTTGTGSGYDNYTNITYESTYPEYTDSSGSNPPTSAQVLLGRPPKVDDGTIQSVVSLTFDSGGDLTRIDYADTSYELWQYNSNNQETYYRDREGIVTLTEYNTNGQVIRIVQGLVDVSGPGTETTHSSTTPIQKIFGYNTNDQLEWEATNAYVSGTITAPAADVRTDYVYGTNKQLETVYGPKAPNQTNRPRTDYEWEGANLVSMKVYRDSTTETTTYSYDSRNRLVKTTFPDGTTEEIAYTSNGLTTYRKDRSNIVSATTVDSAGRVTTRETTLAYDTDLTNVDINGTPSTVFERLSDQVSTTSYLYSPGESQPHTVVTDGRTTKYTYDYKERLTETRRFTGHRGGTEQAQVTSTEYKSNMRFAEESSFGTVSSGTYTPSYTRKIYFGYSADGTTVRTVQVASTSTTYADNTAVLNATRPSSTAANPSVLITDAVRDLSGNIVSLTNPLGATRLTTYDKLGRPLSVKPDSANFTSYVKTNEYDVWGNVTKSTDPAGVETTRQFDPSGRYQISEVFGANSTTLSMKTEFTYDRSGRQDSVIAPGTDGLPDSNRTTSVFYDAVCCGQTIGTRDALGHGVIQSSDPSGRVVHTAQIEDYDTHTSLLNPTDAKTTGETTTRYLDDGKVQFRTLWSQSLDEDINRNLPQLAGLGKPASWGVTTQYVYDLAVGDGSGLETSTGESVLRIGTSQNVNVSIAAAITKLEESVANGGADLSLATHNGSATLIVSPDEKTMQATITDASGRTVMSALLSGPAATTPNQLLDWNCFQYDHVYNLNGVGNVEQIKQIDFDGNVISDLNDSFGWGIGFLDQDSNLTRFEFDPGGQPLKVTDALSNETTYVYDSLGRRTSVTSSAGTTSTAYNAATGQLTSQADEKGKSTGFQYDALGRLSITTDRLNQQSSRSYYRTGKLASVIDAESRTTSYEYDALGRRTELELHAIGSGTPQKTTYAYDSVGRMKTVTLHSGAKRELSYEFSGVLDKVEYFNPSLTLTSTDQFTYDAFLRRTASNSTIDNVTHTYTYTDRGQLDTDTTNYSNQNYVVNYDYDSRGRLNKIIYPSGRAVEYSFTNRNEMDTVKWNGNQIEDRTYDALGRLTSVDRAHVDETRAYDNANRVTSIANTNLGTATYTYDANSNKLGETWTGILSNWSFTTEDSGATDTDGYDDEDRFIRFEQSSQSKDYDLVRSNTGSVTDRKLNGASQSRTFNEVHQLTSLGGTSQTFDANGSLTISHTGMTLSWQEGNARLAQTVVPSGATIGIEGTNDYGYDADNRRVWKKITRGGAIAENTVYIYAGPNCIAEYDGGTAAATPKQEYLYAQNVDSLLMIAHDNNSEQYNVLRNEQWSVVGLAKVSDGSIVETYSYDIFGNRTILAGDGTTARTQSSYDNPYGYTSRRHDEESGLMYMRARYYDPEVNEFICQDPLEFVDGPSLYRGYFALNGVDPWGLADLCKELKEKLVKLRTQLQEVQAKLARNKSAQKVHETKIRNLRRELEEQKRNFANDPLTLPATHPDDHINKKVSRRGHQLLVSEYHAAIEKNRALLERLEKTIHKQVVQVNELNAAIAALTAEIAACEKLEREAREKCAKSGCKGVLKRCGKFVLGKTPLALVFFVCDTCNGGVEHAMEELYWPLSAIPEPDERKPIDCNGVFSSNNKCKCFEEGTLVSTPEGFVAISELNSGDIVYGYDEKNLCKIITRVTKIDIHRERQKVVELHLFGREQDESIIVTPNHPVFVGRGWVHAENFSHRQLSSFLRKGTQIDSVRVQKDIGYLDVTYNIQTTSGNYLVGKHEIVASGRTSVRCDDESQNFAKNEQSQ